MEALEAQPLLPSSENKVKPVLKLSQNHKFGGVEIISVPPSSRIGFDHVGFAFVSFSAVCFGVGLTIFRYLHLQNYLRPLQVTFLVTFTFFVLSSICIFFGIRNRQITPTISKSTFLWLTLRGSGGAVCIVLLVSSLEYIPAGDSDAIFFISPIITIFLAIPILGETISFLHIVAALLSLTGCIVVASPSPVGEFDGVDPAQRVIGSMFAFAAALTNSVVMIAVRKVVTTTHFMFSVWFLGIFGVLVSIPFGGAISFQTLTHNSFLSMLCLVAAALVFIGQVTYSYGFRFCPASTGSVIRNLEIPTAYTLSVFILHEHATVSRLFGAALVVAGSVMIPCAKCFARLPSALPTG